MLKKIKNSRIFSLLQVLFFIGICFVIGAGAAYIQHKSDPTDKAVLYFRAFLENDYEEMYQYVEKEEGQYIDKDMYISLMKNIRSDMKIDSYEILDPIKNGDKYEVSVKCVNQDKDSIENFVINLSKKRSGLQIIPDYTIDISLMLVDDVTIEIPTGYKLLLNNKEVTDIKPKSEDKKHIYEIKALLNGNYTVAAEDEYSALKKSMQVVKNGETIKLSGDNYTASSRYQDLIVKNSEAFIEQFNKAVRNRKPERKEMLKLVSKDIKEKVSQYALEAQSIVYWPEIKTIADYTVSEMKLSEFDKKIVYNKKKNNYTVTYKYSYDYKSETSTALYNSYVYVLGGTCKTTLKMTYDIKDEKVVLSDITMENENEKKEDNSLKKE